MILSYVVSAESCNLGFPLLAAPGVLWHQGHDADHFNDAETINNAVTKQ